MQAIEIKNETLHVTTQPQPVPAPDEVLIKVAASGMNRADYLQMLGKYPAPEDASALPGLEVAGEVVAAGSRAAHRWHVGDRVAALMGGGGYAEYATAHMDLCLPLPAHIPFVQGAAVPEALFTVWNNIFMRGALKSGETILIHGGTSGIGTFAIQAASAWGAVVYTTTSSREKVEFCEKLGANMAIDRTEQDYADVLKATPINVVLSMGGGADIARDLRIMAPDGRHISIAFMSGAKGEIDIPTIMKKRLTITGSTLRGRPLAEQSAIAAGVREHLLPMLATGRIEPVIDRVFPLSEAAGAMAYFTSGRHLGKVILTNT